MRLRPLAAVVFSVCERVDVWRCVCVCAMVSVCVCVYVREGGLDYSLRLISYSLKNLKEIAGALRKVIAAVCCSFLKFLNRKPIAEVLTKFVDGVYCGASAKFAWAKSIVISECSVGRFERKFKAQFAARGWIVKQRCTKSNLSIKLGLNGEWQNQFNGC